LLALVTLFVLSLLVFFGTQILPGDVARRILGPFATQEAVDTLNARLGTDRPLVTQYLSWIGGVVRGDLGVSHNFARPVSELVGRALSNSAKLAAVAFVIVVPLGILGGVLAGLRQGKWVDRVISVGSLSVTVIPEFVSGIVLILVFGIILKWLPVTARPPDGAGLLTQVRYLILPAIPLVLVLFGYIARITRAGVVEALNADYTRTAILKGLPSRKVVVRHVLRNALLPTIAVVATQIGYLIGGLVAIEVLFTYQGIGQLLYTAVQKKDFPLLQSGVLVVGATYLIATLVADIAYSVLNPRIRLAGVD
jgi:peptide/nickel transport system permease protein